MFRAFFISTWEKSFRAARGEFPAHVQQAEARAEIAADHYLLLGRWATMLALLVLSPGVVLCWYLAPLALFAPTAFFISLPEHYATASGRDPLANIRTIRSNFLLRTFYWNNNYHAEHHAFPPVPWDNLPALAELIADKRRFTARPYAGFHLGLIRDLMASQSGRATRTGHPPREESGTLSGPARLDIRRARSLA